VQKRTRLNPVNIAENILNATTVLAPKLWY